MKLWNDPIKVGYTPIITTFLLEYANIGQLWRMWHEHTAVGQNLWSWVSVWIALLLFVNFYRVCCPKEKFAFWATVIGMIPISLIIPTVVFFRYF